MTLDAQLAAAPPRADLLVEGDRRFSSADVDELVGRLAGGFAASGVRRGDQVAFQLPNWWETYVVYRALWRLGAVAVALHHLAADAQLDACLGQVSPRVLLAADGLPLAARPGVLRVRGDDDAWPGLVGSALVPPGLDRATGDRATDDDVAVILFTSGSTGAPKGVVHTHGSCAYKGRGSVAIHDLTPADAVLMPAPLAHSSGLLNGLLAPGTAGMKTVLVPRWSPALGLELLERERVTFMVGPPTFFVGMLDDPGFAPERVASLRLVSSGGAGVSPAFVRRATEALGAVVKRTYGSTEAPTVATTVAGDDPERCVTTDGHAVGDARFRVVDPVSLADRAPGEPGELLVQGPELCRGYLDPAQTAAAFVDGWFRTGDLATLDADGWLTIVGRIKDVIIRAGENIAAPAVEAVLEAHPSVSQAVCVGEPDDRLGERVCAFVVATGPFDLDECRRWCEAEGLTRFMWPERVEVVAELPLLPAGKPDKQALRDRLRFGPPELRS